VVAALLGIALVLLVATRPQRGFRRDAEAMRPHVLRDLREGFSFVLRTPWLLWTLLSPACSSSWCLARSRCCCRSSRRIASDGAQAYGFILAFFGVGSALGALAVSSRRLPRAT